MASKAANWLDAAVQGAGLDPMEEQGGRLAGVAQQGWRDHASHPAGQLTEFQGPPHHGCKLTPARLPAI
jgi:hypothetical protein